MSNSVQLPCYEIPLAYHPAPNVINLQKICNRREELSGRILLFNTPQLQVWKYNGRLRLISPGISCFPRHDKSDRSSENLISLFPPKIEFIFH